MSAAGVAERGRLAAERIMTDACVIVRPADTATLDPATGRTSRAETVLYTGKCRVKVEFGHSVGDVGAGETAVSSVTPIVSVPISVTNVRAGDWVRMTASSDDALDAARLLVRTVKSGSFNTARRLICEVL